MSEENKEEIEKVDPEKAIKMAMAEVRSKGLSDGHIQALFEGEEKISAREALLISHIQHLEHKVEALSGAIEDIANLEKSGGAYKIAKTALEKIIPSRKIQGDQAE